MQRVNVYVAHEMSLVVFRSRSPSGRLSVVLSPSSAFVGTGTVLNV